MEPKQTVEQNHMFSALISQKQNLEDNFEILLVLTTCFPFPNTSTSI
jgi:hypothetical protein